MKIAELGRCPWAAVQGAFLPVGVGSVELAGFGKLLGDQDLALARMTRACFSPRKLPSVTASASPGSPVSCRNTSPELVSRLLTVAQR